MMVTGTAIGQAIAPWFRNIHTRTGARRRLEGCLARAAAATRGERERRERPAAGRLHGCEPRWVRNAADRVVEWRVAERVRYFSKFSL
jgi:hypothetical protein